MPAHAVPGLPWYSPSPQLLQVFIVLVCTTNTTEQAGGELGTWSMHPYICIYRSVNTAK